MSHRPARRRSLTGALVAFALVLLAGPSTASALSVKYNFGPAGTPAVSGYTLDTGLAFAAGRGYGWIRQDSLSGSHVGLDLSGRARDRNVVADQRIDTLIHINGTGLPAGAWEAAVPNDTYDVTVSAGDPAYFDSSYRVNVEGQQAVNFTPNSSTSVANRSRSGTVTVNVTDGRLTLDGIGGTNGKFQYVTIDTATAPPNTTNLKLNFGPSGTPGVSGYALETGQPFTAGRGFGWVRADSLDLPTAQHVPADASGGTRDRNAITDQRLDTLIHMQPGGGTAVAFEAAVPNGQYDYTVGVGDPTAFDSTNDLAIEGQGVMEEPFTPLDISNRFRFVSGTVTVNDGRFTLAATGSNTKISYLTLVTAPDGPARPEGYDPAPADGVTGVARGRAMTFEVRLPNVALGVSEATLTPANVRIAKVSDNSTVAANANTSGGNDVIVLQPQALLEKNTEYRVELTSGVKDLAGGSFVPKTTYFRTNSDDPGTPTDAAFTKSVQTTSAGNMTSSLTIGPDNRLYAVTLDGKVMRYPINADGSLATPTTINTIRTAEGGDRHLIGLAFDPAATASNPILWVTSNAAAYTNAPDWSGKIVRLSGANLETYREVVTNLPRSVSDHESNSLAFGPDGALYMTQGSMSATGAPDAQWGNRPEHLLSAAVLRIATGSIAGTLNVRTAEGGGTYNPWAPGAPVSIYASGVRNAYDLVWHSNGGLYVPTNGSAANGNAPGTPSTLPAACNTRIDAGTRGNWTGPAVGGVTSLPVQPDLLFKVVQGGYYGHPNPARCEYAFFGGNPTGATDPFELAKYPIGTQPDRNWRAPAHSFGDHFSPNGAIEYKSGRFGGALTGRLLVVRYSAGDDLVALTFNAQGAVIGQEDGISGFGGFKDPLDVTEDTRNGNLYVAELGNARIQLLRPNESSTGGTGSVIYRVNAGSASSATDALGNTWRADTGLFSPAHAASEGAPTDAIANTDDDAIFAVNRGNVGSSTPLAQRYLDYTLPTSATRVSVKLLFAERYWTLAGKRTLDVYAENVKQISALDIFAAAGGKDRALTRTIPSVDVTGGQLNLRIQAVKDMPLISGIEVTCTAGCS